MYLIKWEGEDEEYATWESHKGTTQKWAHLLKQFKNTLHNKNKSQNEMDIIKDLEACRVCLYLFINTLMIITYFEE